MRKLFHYPLDPASRQARIALAEKKLKVKLEQRDWLAGKSFSLADIAGAANMSCLDFLGEIKWRDWPELKRWYQTVKSRPSVQALLQDRVAGLRPPRHYTDLDF